MVLPLWQRKGQGGPGCGPRPLREYVLDKKVYLLEDDRNIAELVKCALEMSNIAVECFETIASLPSILSLRFLQRSRCL